MRVSRAILVVALALIAGVVLWFRLRVLQTTDPDYFFHVALSRWSLEHGLPHQLPQLVGIGWDKEFVDKEFLFHRLTTFAYWLGGEKAVGLVPFALWEGLIALVVGVLAFEAGLVAAGVGAAVLLVSSYLNYRFVLVRPHGLGVPIFLALFLALRKNRKVLAALAGVAFSLAYHAIQGPLLLIALRFALSWRTPSLDERARERSAALWAVGGLGVGLLANPYFPGVLFISLQVSRIALDLSHGATLPYGNELYPWSSAALVSRNVLAFAVLATVAFAGRAWRFEVLAAAGFWILSALSPRGQEYALPLTALAAVVLAGGEWRRLGILAPVACGLAAQAVAFVPWVLESRDAFELPTHLLEAVRAIPAGSEGALVFNCFWDSTPELFYARPELRFLDILDPSFLRLAAPVEEDARAQLLGGGVVDAYGLLRDLFGARYVYCGAGALVDQLEVDPRFARIFPSKKASGDWFVYELVPKPERHLVDSYEVSNVDESRATELQGLEPDGSLEWRPAFSESRKTVPYLDLRKADKVPELAKGGEPKTRCHWVRPARDGLSPFEGAELVGLGGGPNLRLWVNGRREFQSVGAPGGAALVQVLVPLERPLGRNDRFEALVCSPAGTSYEGVALSFWKRQDVDQFCKSRHSPYVLTRTKNDTWNYVGVTRPTCIAPVAARTRF
jgi:hypothetical protein